MRVVIAMMKHETNTFSPVPTPIERFARGYPLPPRGAEALKAFKGTGSAMAAFIDICEREGWEMLGDGHAHRRTGRPFCPRSGRGI